MSYQRRHRQAGFTIVELMISLTVLSILLIIAAAVLTHIGGLYQKGLNQSNVQDDSRGITSQIGQDLQLGPAASFAASTSYRGIGNYQEGVFCINGLRYTYVLGQVVDATHHGVWRDQPSGGCTTDVASMPTMTGAAAPSASGSELLNNNERLTKLTITKTPINASDNLFAISVGIAYGPDDLLCDSGTPNDCKHTPTNSTHIWNPTAPVSQVTCRGNVGDQFCATSYLTVTVENRVD
ncbi:MAG TPA: prepilin-type N-terminal cleavage/methylation domain-containing protein [Candidatus Saccharimonadales bacterium]|nr:prepilin-type N-terminal cleavage/methylation domain-containing protein [Candidatus Saccharimonadales bacterium]